MIVYKWEKVNANVFIVNSVQYFVSKNNHAIHLWQTIADFVFNNCLSVFLFRFLSEFYKPVLNAKRKNAREEYVRSRASFSHLL